MTVTKIKKNVLPHESHGHDDVRFCLQRKCFKTLRIYVPMILFILFFRLFLFDVKFVSGESMFPSMHDGSIVAVQKFNLSSINRGDVIVIDNDGESIIKRVIGLPGDLVRIDENGYVSINGNLMPQKYQIGIGRSYGVGDWVVGKDEVFVLGDNRGNSEDSQIHGVYDMDSVTGKIFGILL